VEGVSKLGESDGGSDRKCTGWVSWESAARWSGVACSRVVLCGRIRSDRAYYYGWFYMVTFVVRTVVLCVCEDPESTCESRKGEHVREIVRYLGREPGEFDELVCVVELEGEFLDELVFVVELEGEFLEVRCPLPFHGDLRHLVQRQRRPSRVHHSSLRA